MKNLLALLLVLFCFQGVLAEQVPVTIWQKEKRTQPVTGDIVTLQRGPFTLLLPLADKENIGLAAGPGNPPHELKAFELGRGMAGPYDGLFLTWEAFHYFHVDSSVGPPRMELWDPAKGLYYWKPLKVYDNTGATAIELDWDTVPDLTFIVRKDGFEDKQFQIKWAG